MKIKRLSLKEYEERKEKSYLEKCLENNTAKYYVVTYNNKEYEFWFYIENIVADLCINKKDINYILKSTNIFNEIINIIKDDKKIKIIKIAIDKNDEIANEMILKYGFIKKSVKKVSEKEFLNYEKTI